MQLTGSRDFPALTVLQSPKNVSEQQVGGTHE